MKGKFIGKSSMGFQNGITYNIRSDIKMIRRGGSEFSNDMMCICIYDMNSKAWCPYQSLDEVMKNWVFLVKSEIQSANESTIQ